MATIHDEREYPPLRGGMAASFAHDLKTPLTAIRVELELLEESYQEGTLDTDLFERAIVSLLEQVGQMRQEIDRVVSSVLPGSQPMVDVCVQELMQQVVCALHRSACQSQVAIDVDVEAGLLIATRVHALRHVLENLVVNAIEAMPNGGRVVLAARTWASGVEIRVDDTGPGVPEELRERVFELAMSTKGDARGIGLANCRQIVEEQLSGMIHCEAAEGGGASFVVLLAGS